MKKQQGFIKAAFLVWLVFIIGWIANIVQVFQQMPGSVGDITGMPMMWLVKIICIFIAPVGAVLGYVGMF